MEEIIRLLSDQNLLIAKQNKILEAGLSTLIGFHIAEAGERHPEDSSAVNSIIDDAQSGFEALYHAIEKLEEFERLNSGVG